jgi:shikimate kinase
MMNDYYSYHPTHKLDRPLALISFANALTRKVAHEAASLTGLPAIHLDDSIQHFYGVSSHTIIQERGLRAWRYAESRELGKALTETPPSILSLGEGAIEDLDDLQLVLDSARLVYIHLPLDDAVRLAGRQDSVRGATLWAEAAALGDSWDENIRALYAKRHFNYKMAHYTIEASNLSTKAITEHLMRLIPSLEEYPALSA